MFSIILVLQYDDFWKITFWCGDNFYRLTNAVHLLKATRPIPKQGDTVTWLINDFLIIGTQLGERRKHIPRSTDSRYYEPEFEKYIGQFPVDFIPEPRPQLSMQAFFPLKNLWILGLVMLVFISLNLI